MRRLSPCHPAVALAAMLCCAIAQAQELPEGMRHVPPNAAGFLHVSVDSLLQSELGREVLALLEGDELRLLEQKLKITPGEIESLTDILLLPDRKLPDDFPFTGAIVCTMKKRYDRAKLDPISGPIAEALRDEGLSVWRLSERSFLLGPPEGLLHYGQYVARSSGKPDQLQSAFELAMKKHDVVAGGHVSPNLSTAGTIRYLERQYGASRGSALLAAMAPLMHLRSAALSLDCADKLRANLYLHGTNAQSAALASESMKTLTAYLQSMPADAFAVGAPLGKLLADARFQHEGNTSHISLEASLERIRSFKEK